MFGTRFLLEKKSHNAEFEDVKKSLDTYALAEAYTYNFYFRLGRVYNFPNGYQIGDGKLYAFKDLPRGVRNFISLDYHRWDVLDRGDASKLHESIKDYEEDWFMHIQVKSLGREKAREKAILNVKRSIGIIKLVYGSFNDLYPFRIHTPFYFHYLIEERPGLAGSGRPGRQSKTPLTRIDVIDDIIRDINIIVKNMKNGNASNLEGRILNAIDAYGMTDESTPLHIRFMLCIIALEGLLLDKADKDYLGWKLAEKISFLLGETKEWLDILNKRDDNTFNVELCSYLVESRARLADTVRDLYTKRSGFAHKGLTKRDKEYEIKTEDYNLASLILKMVIEKLIELSKKE